MGLFKTKSDGAGRAHVELPTGQAFGDPEQPPSARSAPELDNPLAPIGSGSAAVPPQSSRAVSEPALGAGDKQAAAQLEHLTPAQRRTLAHLMTLSKVMDNAITVPIINKKFGLDAILGLIPYIGDLAGATVGSYIISRALKYNMPKRLVLRMLVNQTIDSCVGVIPFVGDLFDFAFKANARNMRLLQEHLEHPKKGTRADTCFLCSLFFLVVVLPVMLMVGIVAGIILGILAAVGKL
ncbi:hypothetical protein COO60DRAFT_793930 [Scenedesmus sp. NREL 46B-D3]|nr:hypothetical protein COO60DRAFT_793930 [Scenedesmus sp. NREL 46B-D3]